MHLARTRKLALFAILALALACIAPSLAFAETGGQLVAAGSDVEGITAGTQEDQASVTYHLRTQDGTWLAKVKDGVTSGSSKAANALQVKLSSSIAGSVEYQANVDGYGWRKVVSNGKSAGAKGKKKSINAVKMALSGELSKTYSISYRVKVKGGKWQAWKSDGAIAGSTKGKAIIAVKVKLVEKSKASAEGEGLVGVRYRAYLRGERWRPWQADNTTAGRKTASARLQRLAVSLDTGAYSGSVKYRVLKLNDDSWGSWRKNGVSTGGASSLEAVQVKLSGTLADKYDVVYRVYIQGVGWQKRVRNGETAGAVGFGAPISAIRIQLVDKNKRTGWIGKDSNWQFYKKGKVLKSQWVKTTESPMDPMQGSADVAQRYWVDSAGKLAVDRIVNPKTSRDKGAKFKAYAMPYGYIMIDETKMIGSTWYTANAKGHLSETTNAAEIFIARYVNWAIDIANDDSHGYSQAVRWGPDYDCSSLVISALRATGYNVEGATYTGNMRSELTRHGFRWHSGTSGLRRGDIMLVHREGGRQHTEIYIGKNKTVGAHIAETGGVYGVIGDQTGNEICIAKYSDIWQGYLRYAG